MTTLRIDPVFEKQETYCKPQNNQILNLRGKLGKIITDEYITKAKQLIKKAGYPEQMKYKMMRDILVYGIESDQVHRDTINIGDTLTYKQVYNPAKME